MNRIAIYIDGGVFTDGVRGQGMSMDMDYKSLLQPFAGEGAVVAIHFVTPEYPEVPYPAKHRNEKIRLEMLAAQGMEIHVTKPQVIGSIFIDRGVEAVLTARLILDAQADVFDTALVVSRRGELSLAVTAARALGKTVNVAFFDYHHDPVNPLAACADKALVISPQDVVAQRRSGPRPPAF